MFIFRLLLVSVMLIQGVLYAYADQKDTDKGKSCLPPVVYSCKPAIIRITIKGEPVDGDGYDIGVKYSHPMLNTDYMPFDYIDGKERKSYSVRRVEDNAYEVSVAEMCASTMTHIYISNKDGKVYYVVYGIFNPGEKSSVTIERQKDGYVTCKFKGRLARLNHDINRMRHSSAKDGMSYDRLGLYGSTAYQLNDKTYLSSIIFRPTFDKQQCDSILSIMEARIAEVEADRTTSPEFKEWYRLNTHGIFASALMNAWWRIKDQQDVFGPYIRKYLPISLPARPYLTYMDMGYEVRAYADIFGYDSREQEVLCPSITWYNKARLYKDRLTQQHVPLTDDELRSATQEVPEFMPIIQRMQTRMCQLKTEGNPRSHLCQIPHEVEGDSILTAILSQHKGRNIIISNFETYGLTLSNLKVRGLLAEEVFKYFDYVTICSNARRNEEWWSANYPYIDGYHYYLMQHQARYIYEKSNCTSHSNVAGMFIIIDKDGNILATINNSMEKVTDVLRRLIQQEEDR